MVYPKTKFYPDNCAGYVKPVGLSFWHRGLSGLGSRYIKNPFKSQDLYLTMFEHQPRARSFFFLLEKRILFFFGKRTLKFIFPITVYTQYYLIFVSGY